MKIYKENTTGSIIGAVVVLEDSAPPPVGYTELTTIEEVNTGGFYSNSDYKVVRDVMKDMVITKGGYPMLDANEKRIAAYNKIGTLDERISAFTGDFEELYEANNYVSELGGIYDAKMLDVRIARKLKAKNTLFAMLGHAWLDPANGNVYYDPTPTEIVTLGLINATGVVYSNLIYTDATNNATYNLIDMYATNGITSKAEDGMVAIMDFVEGTVGTPYEFSNLKTLPFIPKQWSADTPTPTMIDFATMWKNILIFGLDK